MLKYIIEFLYSFTLKDDYKFKKHEAEFLSSEETGGQLRVLDGVYIELHKLH